jgi:hypothetical protein
MKLLHNNHNIIFCFQCLKPNEVHEFTQPAPHDQQAGLVD